MKRFSILCSAIALVSCSGTPAPNYIPISKSVSFPALGVESEAALGEDMVRQGIYTETDGVEYKKENNIKGYKLSAGFYPQISEDNKYTYHSFGIRKSQDGSGYIIQAKDIFGIPLGIPESIRVSKTKQETCIIAGGLARPICDTEVAFQRVKHPALSERDFQQTLIYSGRVGNKIKIGYRESSGGYARNAFSNEAEYDLSTSSEIGYRGARLKIISADNSKIRYVVTSNFNSPNKH